MATYRDDRYVHKSPSLIFEGLLHPGTRSRHSGIYRCVTCGLEAVSVAGDALPSQNSHQHTASQGDVRWELIVCAEHRADRDRQPG